MIQTQHVRLDTLGNDQLVDLTPRLRKLVTDSGLTQGTVTVFVSGSTAGVTTMEFEPGLVTDMAELAERLAPRSNHYEHHLTEGDDNGFSHLRASTIGPSLVIPFEHGRLALGVWQQVVLWDFDVRPRRRDIVVQLLGE